MNLRSQLKRSRSAKPLDLNHSKRHNHHSHPPIVGPQCRQLVLPVPIQLDLPRLWMISDQNRYPGHRPASPQFTHPGRTTSLTLEQTTTSSQMSLFHLSLHSRHSVQQGQGFWAQQEDKMTTENHTLRFILRNSVKQKVEYLLKLRESPVRRQHPPTTGTTLILLRLFQPLPLNREDQGLRHQKSNRPNQVLNTVLPLLFIPTLQLIHRLYLQLQSRLLLRVHLQPRFLLGLQLFPVQSQLPPPQYLWLRQRLQKLISYRGSQVLRHSVLLP